MSNTSFVSPLPPGEGLGVRADVDYRISPPISNEALNRLFADSWPNHVESDFGPVLQRSLTYVCAYVQDQQDQLVGFVNVAWDGGIHAILLDTTVHPAVRRRGIGIQLVRKAAEVAQARGIHWLHVDYEPHLADYYAQCGFVPTQAGLIRLNSK